MSADHDTAVFEAAKFRDALILTEKALAQLKTERAAALAELEDARAHHLRVLQTLSAMRRRDEAAAQLYVEALHQIGRVPQLRPISKAPRDGTRILAWSWQSECWQMVKWLAEDSQWASTWDQPLTDEIWCWLPVPAAPNLGEFTTEYVNAETAGGRKS